MGIIEQAKEFGLQQSQGKAVMPNLAIHVAKAAEAGEIDEQDAASIYEAYTKTAWRTSQRLDMDATTNRVQVSKLRQIIKLGNTFGAGLLLKVMRMHHSSGKTHKVKWAYAAMVDVARAQLARPSPLSEKQILSLVLRKPPSR